MEVQESTDGSPRTSTPGVGLQTGSKPTVRLSQRSTTAARANPRSGSSSEPASGGSGSETGAGIISETAPESCTDVSTIQRLAAGATDDSLRVAIAVGLASVPVSLLLSWDSLSGETAATGAQFDGLAVLVAGVIVGFYYHDRSTSTKRAGIWTGLTGGLAAVIVFGFPTLGAITSPSETHSIIVVFAPVVAVLAVGLSVGIAVVTALGTDWVLGRLDRDHRRREPVDIDGQPTGSRWWVAVALYAVVAPVWLAVLLWPDPDTFGFGLSFLSAFGLFACSVVAFIGLFLDATTPRAVDTWQPMWWLYVGVPPAVAGFVYLAATVRDSVYPAGDATFGFYIGLAAVAVVYAVVRHRQTGTDSSSTNFE